MGLIRNFFRYRRMQRLHDYDQKFRDEHAQKAKQGVGCLFGIVLPLIQIAAWAVWYGLRKLVGATRGRGPTRATARVEPKTPNRSISRRMTTPVR